MDHIVVALSARAFTGRHSNGDHAWWADHIVVALVVRAAGLATARRPDRHRREPHCRTDGT